MKSTHPAFWGAGLAGLFIGVLLVLISLAAPAELRALTGGYGLMMIGSAGFLIAGLALLGRFGRRTVAISASPNTLSGTSRS